MTHSIQSFSAVNLPPLAQAPMDAQKTGELLAGDTLTNPRVRQFAMFAKNMFAAWARQDAAADKHAAEIKASAQFGTRAAAQLGLDAPMSTVKPTLMDLDAHPEIAEELNRHRLRESRAAAELDAAIRHTERARIDLLRAIGFLQPEDFPANPQEPEDLHGDKRPSGDGAPMINPADSDATGLIWGSHSEFYDKIGLLIAALQENWLSKFQDAMAKYLEFYKEFSDAMEAIYVEPHGEKGDVKFDPTKAYPLLDAIMKKYGVDSGALASFSTKQGAEDFIKGLGLPGLEPSLGADGEWKVKMNLDDVQQVINSFPSKGGVVHEETWDPAFYNAWLSKKDSNVEQVKHVSKVLGEKLSEATQKFDSIVKQLSATIDEITRCDMGFINGF